jgi:hypothetical protein
MLTNTSPKPELSVSPPTPVSRRRRATQPQPGRAKCRLYPGGWVRSWMAPLPTLPVVRSDARSAVHLERQRSNSRGGGVGRPIVKRSSPSVRWGTRPSPKGRLAKPRPSPGPYLRAAAATGRAYRRLSRRSVLGGRNRQAERRPASSRTGGSSPLHSRGTAPSQRQSNRKRDARFLQDVRR